MHPSRGLDHLFRVQHAGHESGGMVGVLGSFSRSGVDSGDPQVDEEVGAYMDQLGIPRPPPEKPSGPPPPRMSLRALSNPFRGTLRLELALPSSAPVVLEIYDARGRRLNARNYGVLGPGLHVLSWDGDDRHGARVGAGSFWARVKAGNEHLRQQVVRIE